MYNQIKQLKDLNYVYGKYIRRTFYKYGIICSGNNIRLFYRNNDDEGNRFLDTIWNYFEKDGNFYHHILNPKTGYPYDNSLISVTIISDKSVDGDGLSTTCFALGLEKGMELINSLPDVQAVFITDDYQLHYSDHFNDELTVIDVN